MRIKLIYPKMHDTTRGTKVKYRLAPPQSLLALAAVTPTAHAVEICDENVRPLSFDDRPDLVGITVYVASANRAYEISRHYRERGVPTVLGGLHVTAMPDEAIQHADSIVVGEAEEAWPRLLSDLQAGRLRRRYDGGVVSLKNLAALPRDLTPRHEYLTRNCLLASRGCNRHCAFCYKTARSDSPYRRRPVECVVQEVSQLDGGCVALLDDNLAADPGYARRLFTALCRCNKVWMGAASIDVARNERLLDAMAESGCCSLFIGLESITQANLDAMRKGANRVDEYAEHIARIRGRGIMVNGSFVFGFDGDDASVFDRTVDWSQECCIDTATFHILTPYPGTPLFAQLDREGRIVDHNWDHYDTAHVVFRPKFLSADELLAGYQRAYDRFYAAPAILHRVLAIGRGRLPRLMPNVGYKRMNFVWPLLAACGMTWLPFRLFVAALRFHRYGAQTRIANSPELADTENAQ